MSYVTDLERTLSAIGSCPDQEQRVKDLYVVNTFAGQTRVCLKLLRGIAEVRGIDSWVLKELQSIENLVETIESLEEKRQTKKPAKARKEHRG